ncbi:xylan 1,4-beta-xylosidase [Sphaerisporangium sp. NPDC049002]|uniref:GH39 family glycosyl hydrolase n=1 Tax=unclassified Sphaerisporangium TaxID=2630420 RepID=UPI0033D03EE3
MLESNGRHARSRYVPRGPVAVGAGLVALAMVVGLLAIAAHRGGGRSDGVAATILATPEPPPTLEQPPVVDSWPRWGVTHTQYSADNEDRDVHTRVSDLFSRVPMLQNQHIMGWGAGNPEPAPGKYDFRDLDRRVELMAATKAQPVLTLCCAPDWMKGGAEGRTDWGKIEGAPLRDHFDDFAKLAATVAKRYPTVTHFMVWNEFKGFWDDAHNNWDVEAYTDLYNRVYDAVKAANPKAQVGGPYIPIDSHVSSANASTMRGPWGAVDSRALDGVDYWLKNKRGADFIVVDASSATNDRGLVPDEFTAVKKFSAVTTWLRQKSGDLPVWWAEWYVAPDSADWDERHRTAVQTAAMMEFARSGAATALYWNPQRRVGDDCPGCMWSPGAGDEMPMAGLLSGFTRWFPAGARLVDVPVSDPRVQALAVPNQMIMVNTTGEPLSVDVDGRAFQLGPYDVKWSDRGQ